MGKKQQFLYMYDDNVIGEQWIEIREMERTATTRYEMINTIDVDGTAYGSPWKSWGKSVTELDEWGFPIYYEAEVFGPTEDNVRRVRAEVNPPQVDFFISQNGEEPQSYSQPVSPDARLVDFIFLGPYDLALRLQPFTPQRSVVERNWVVPNMNFAMKATLDVLYEETIVTPLGEEYPTARLTATGLLLDLWYAPGGKLVKAVISSPYTVVYAGKTIMPGDEEASDGP